MYLRVYVMIAPRLVLCYSEAATVVTPDVTAVWDITQKRL